MEVPLLALLLLLLLLLGATLAAPLPANYGDSRYTVTPLPVVDVLQQLGAIPMTASKLQCGRSLLSVMLVSGISSSGWNHDALYYS